jgi:hypothetical protein
MTGPNRPSRDGRLRSFWQVLAVYIGASWVVLQVTMGLPAWVFPLAVVVLIGLPIKADPGVQPRVEEALARLQEIVGERG